MPKCVIGSRMEKWVAFLFGANASCLEVMNVTDLQTFDFERNRFAVLSQRSALDRGSGVIDLRATVLGLKNIGVSLHRV